MGVRYLLGDATLIIGRSEECDIRINDYSVSRRHARIEREGDHYRAIDLDSTNGTFVNDAPAAIRELRDGDYLRVGNCIYRFLAGGNVEAEYHEEIYRLTIIDALTGIANKRFLLEFLDREVARSNRHNRPLAVLMIDVDHFKTVNDHIGHLGGDIALREVANVIRQNVRCEDLCARFGGEEFALILVEATHAGAVDLGERVRALVEQHRLTFQDRTYHVTISVGVGSTDGSTPITASEILRQADERLYRAKQTGRNRVVGE
jgi:diguanylate cyclase (GGDEF)-like protein